MKTCPHCDRPLPLDAFNRLAKSPDGRQSYCRDCQRAWYKANAETHKANVRRRQKRYRLEVNEFIGEFLLSHPCVDCGERDPVVLEFDHVSGTKVDNIARMITNGSSIARIFTEIEKCEVRCANCHRRATASRSPNWRTALVAQSEEHLTSNQV